MTYGTIYGQSAQNLAEAQKQAEMLRGCVNPEPPRRNPLADAIAALKEAKAIIEAQQERIRRLTATAEAYDTLRKAVNMRSGVGYQGENASGDGWIKYQIDDAIAGLSDRLAGEEKPVTPVDPDQAGLFDEETTCNENS